MALIFPGLFMGTHLFTTLAFGGCTGILIIVPVWMISKKAGFNPWLSLLIILPLAGLVYLWVLGLADWPSLKEKPASS